MTCTGIELLFLGLMCLVAFVGGMCAVVPLFALREGGLLDRLRNPP